MRPALVATDLDGTIVGRDGSVTERTISAFRRAAEQGVLVVLVTGRPPRWLWPIRDQLGVTGLAICANGALTVDLGTRDIVTRRAFLPAEVVRIARVLRDSLRHKGIPGFAIETGEIFAREPHYVSRMLGATVGPVGTLEDLITADLPVVKLLLRLDGVPADELWQLATAALGEAAVVTHSNPADSLLEIGPPGVTKATSLASLAREVAIPAGDCIAFGDMPNDIPMLTWAGTGYAMADGHPQTLACTEHTAPPCSDDGVAQVLESLLDRPS